MCTKAGIEEWETTILHFGREELLWGVLLLGGGGESVEKIDQGHYESIKDNRLHTNRRNKG